MKHCPNSACSNHKKPPLHWYVKYGYYKPKNTQQKTPRYRCKACGKLFSTHTFKSSVNQKKPEINPILFKMLVSGVSLRRASEILNVKYDTVVRHFHTLARQAEAQHKEFVLLGSGSDYFSPSVYPHCHFTRPQPRIRNQQHH